MLNFYIVIKLQKIKEVILYVSSLPVCVPVPHLFHPKLINGFTLLFAFTFYTMQKPLIKNIKHFHMLIEDLEISLQSVLLFH